MKPIKPRLGLSSLLLVIILLFCPNGVRAGSDSLHITRLNEPISLRPYFRVLEDFERKFSADSLLQNRSAFQPLAAFHPSRVDGVYWLMTRVRSEKEMELVLSFKHLTHADLYLLPDTAGASYMHRKAGAFRPVGEIYNGDSRFHFHFELDEGVPYILLIRSWHNKKYRPIFDFELEELHSFLKHKQHRELVDFWFQGAAMVLLLFVLITWAITRYRPYLWLAIFIMGIIMYNLSLNRYLIDWFFPGDPITGWRFTVHFLHLGIAGFYMLLLDFWKIKKRNFKLYRIGRFIVLGIIGLSILSYCVNKFTGNFRLMSEVNSGFIVVQILFIGRLLMQWKGFDRYERYLGYGVILYLLVSVLLTISLVIFQEKVIVLFSIASGLMLVSVSLFFLAAISGKLWQNEKDKNLYLERITEMQKHQNEELERKVLDRTRELKQRNEHVELLMNELNHRVKNNLQLLYGLNILQLEGSKEKVTTSILKDNITRIKAMMLVNERLNPSKILESSQIAPADFIADIAAHSKIMFPPEKPINMDLQIDKELVLTAKAGLCVGLIVTELITNSYKHAFCGTDEPNISIEIVRDGVYWTLRYEDNGRGMSNPSADSFGLSLITDLTRQLKGKFSVISDRGVKYVFNFPNLI